MSIITCVLVAFVAFLHLAFLILEMFFWTKPLGLKVFRQSLQLAQTTKVLAANQGLYNGFLSAGLVLGLLHKNSEVSFWFCAFFLICVVIAGLYGAISVNRRIFFIQSLPAVLALIGLVLYF